jgi:hypothetical protein
VKHERKPRIADPARARAGQFKALKVDGQNVCLDCRTPVFAPSRRLSKRPRPPLRCSTCKHERFRFQEKVYGRATSAVTCAVLRGDMKRATEYACVDCGRPAEVYDHRDYTQPLKVEPVCRSCNVIRGPADVWPSRADIA